MAGKKRTDKKGRVLKNNEFQRPDGRYMYRFTDLYNKQRYVYSWRLKPEDKMPKGKKFDLSLREKEQQISDSISKHIDCFESKKLTLNSLFDKFIAGKSGLKESTAANYMNIYNRLCRDSIGKMSVGDITYTVIYDFYVRLVKNGMSVSSLGVVQNILHPIFKRALRDHLVFENPTDDIIAEIKKEFNWTNTKKHALSEQEQLVFMNFIKNSKTYKSWFEMFVVFLGTGMRIGELTALTWSDIDFKLNEISINRTLSLYTVNGKLEKHISTPKTEAGNRNIPLMTDVKGALLSLKERQMAKGLFCKSNIDGFSDFVFLNKFGTVYTDVTINNGIKRIVKAYNEQEQKKAVDERRKPFLLPCFSAHILRHTFCSRLCENETDLKAIQSIMGHSNISITMDVYADASEKKKQQVIKNLDYKIKIC